jgi:glycosyltransferase involved in cell wall biosynthesis
MTTLTVVIPVWNRARSVGRAIDSAIAQAVPDGWSMQVLVVDDGSTDDLAQALRSYGNLVRCVAHPSNRGAAAARNTGIAAAEGEYVAFLDSDDAWLPGKLVAQLPFMRSNSYAASCTSYVLTRANKPDMVSPRYATGALQLADLVWGCFVSPGSTLICRRDAYADIGVYDTSLKRLEDWDWLLRYAKSQPLGFLAQPLARIETSTHADPETVLAALGRLRSKHLAALLPHERRHFVAALDVNCAAAHYRRGQVFPAMLALAASLYHSPIENRALASVLYNRFAV